jgi:hypothetical protein
MAYPHHRWKLPHFTQIVGVLNYDTVKSFLFWIMSRNVESWSEFERGLVMPKKEPRVTPALPGRLRRVRNTGDHFRSLTKQWEDALREYLEALAGLNNAADEGKK